MEAQRVLGHRYRLIERLGAGGMSVVWHAHDDVLDRPVAVKVLSAPKIDSAALVRIRSEAKAAARLAHPHITSVHDYGEMPDDSGNLLPYIVMELVRGPTLSERLTAGRLPVRTALLIGVQVASALAAAHAHGFVHRDVKPSNVILSPAGAKVMDFGLAAVAGDAAESGPMIWGTPAYVAPERLTTGEVAPASDVYALGLVLYRMLAGRRPWKADTVSQWLRAHEHVEPARLPARKGLPRPVADVCRRCLAKRPDDRPSAGDVAAVLLDALGGGVIADVLAVPGPATEPDTPVAARAVPIRAVAVAPARSWWTGRTAQPRPAGRGRSGRTLAVGSALVALAVVLLVAFCGPVGRDGRPGDEQGQGTGTPSVGAQLGQITDVPVQPATSPTPQPGAGLPTGAPGAGSIGAGSRSNGSGGGSGSGSGGSGGGSGGGGVGGGGSGGSGGGGSPPLPTPVDMTFPTPGGSVTCRCVGSTAELVSWDALPGFSPVQVNPGPAPTVGLVFNGVVTDVRITFRCSNGVPDPTTDIL